MPPAARVTDMHTCPMITGVVPHVGGPIIKGEATVLVGYMAAARVSDPAACVGPTDAIVKGSPTVLIGHMPAARVGDQTAHSGVIITGCTTVFIGDNGSGGFGGANTPCGAAAQQAKDSRAAMRKRKPDDGPSPEAAAPGPPVAPSPFPHVADMDAPARPATVTFNPSGLGAPKATPGAECAPSPPMAPSPYPNAPSLGGATSSNVTRKGGS